MPSASSKSSQPALQVNVDLLQEPMKGAVCVLEKKLRNLEKRKIKLLDTRKKADLGGDLNDDQKSALKNLDLVNTSLEIVKELHKLMCTLEQDYIKLTKKEQKRAKLEQNNKADTKSHALVFQTLKFQTILGELSEEVRPDFLAGANGACSLTEDELGNLDSLYELISPASSEENSEKKFSVRVQSSGDHLINLVESKDKPAFDDVTYAQLNEILKRIESCGYFDKELANGTVVANEEVAEESPAEEPVTVVDTPTEEQCPSEQATEPEVALTVSTEPINGVDLPPEIQQSNESIDFMGESEIVSGHEGSLNPISPVFVPRNSQTADDGGFEEGETTLSEGAPESGWQSVPDSFPNRGGHRGDRGGGRGFGEGRGRGRGGRGGRGRQDDFRGGRGGRDGSYGGNRGGRVEGERGGYRGGRGGDGGYRGGRGGGGDGFNRGRGGYQGERGRGSYRGDGNRGNRGSRGGRGAPRGGNGQERGGFN